MRVSGEIINSVSQTKNITKKIIFLDIGDIKENVTSEVKRIPKDDDFASCFKQLYELAKMCHIRHYETKNITKRIILLDIDNIKKM